MNYRITNYKTTILLILLCLLVGTASADTAIILNSLEDGRLSRTGVNEYFTSIRNGEGTAIDTASTGYIPFSLIATTTSNKYGTLRRGFLTFNTTLPEPGTITSAVLSVYGYNTGNTFVVGRGNVTITSSNHGYPAAASDFNKFGNLILTTNVTGTTWPLEQYNNFTFTNLSYLNTTGLTKLMFRGTRDVDADEPTWQSGTSMYMQAYPSATTGTNKDPILTIEYTPAGGDTTPPASITNLAADNTSTCQTINWTWDDSVSEDADVLQIWQNGTVFHNVSANQTYDLWEGLTGGIEYEFASHTCDLTGNCNETWVNQSATAGSCAVAPVANFTVNATTGCAPLSVLFTDTSTNTPDDWDWYMDADETKTADVQNPEVTFNVPGIYSIRLWAANLAGGSWKNESNLITATDCQPPASITNLSYTNETCQNTTWTWINPADADYDHLMVWKNDEFDENISAPATSLSWLGITAGLFSSRTCDTLGNCNETWVNMTAPDAAQCDTEPPLAPINLANITTCSNITWSWENVSGDTDYHGVLVYRYDEGDPLGDYFYGFVIEPTFSSFWDDLTEDTDYTIGLKSWDGGNVNDTWVNMTAHTPFCTALPVLAADFTSNVTCGNIPFNVQFNDTSTGWNITSWYWDFGDGNTSELQDGNNTYVTEGMYTVNHSATDDTANVSWKNSTGYIRAVPAWAVCPTVAISYGGASGGGKVEDYSLVFVGIAIVGVFGLLILARR